MSEERFQIRCAAYILVIKENKILLFRRINTGWMDGYYGTPGGHLEANETISQAAIRECFEESGIKVLPDDLEFINTMHRRANFDYVDFFFKAKKWKGEPRITDENKSDDLLWCDINNLPEKTLVSLKEAIKNMQNKILYSEVGFNE